MSALHKFAALLLLALVGFAIAVVHQNHRARKLTTAIAQEQTRTHKLETDHLQMQLERARWTASARVKKVASDELRMQFPDATGTIHLSTLSEPVAGREK